MGVAFADAQIYREAIRYWNMVVAIDSTATVAQSAGAASRFARIPRPAEVERPAGSSAGGH